MGKKLKKVLKFYKIIPIKNCGEATAGNTRKTKLITWQDWEAFAVSDKDIT
jgi:hypothetical protein